MKRYLAVLFTAALLCGCSVQVEPPVTLPSATVELPILGAPGRNVASVILGDIWAQYDQQEKFSIYGGMMEHPVPDAPGDLDLKRPEAWARHCYFPTGCLAMAEQGAAITHLLNEDLLTAAVMRTGKEENLPTLTENWRQEIQRSRRQSGAQGRLLLAQVGQNYLIMATGSKDYVHTFGQKLKQAYPSAKILCDEAVTC